MHTSGIRQEDRESDLPEPTLEEQNNPTTIV
jgi:hypothetical protein